jgi:hypothetical protein
MRTLARIITALWLSVGVGLLLVTGLPRLLDRSPTMHSVFDCGPGCFLGVVPGVTHIEDVERLLAGQVEVIVTDHNVDRGWMTWQYTDPPPPYLSNTRDTTLFYSRDTGIVDEIVVYTDARLWHLATAYPTGTPSSFEILRGDGPPLLVATWAGQVRMNAGGMLRCQSTHADIWSTRIFRLDIRTVPTESVLGERGWLPLLGRLCD